MLVSFQFPIADTRIFHADRSLRLPKPDWPTPNTEFNAQFVHFFGMTKKRHRSPDNAWPDEICYCSACRAVRFENLQTVRVGCSEPWYIYKRFRPRCAFRRLFSDGQSVVRAEIGLAHHERKVGRAAIPLLSANEVIQIVSGLCDLPTRVPGIEVPSGSQKLITRGSSIAKLYARGTLARRNDDKLNTALQLVEAGNPVIIAELGPSESIGDAEDIGFIQIPAERVYGAVVCYGRLRRPEGLVGVWLLGQGAASAPVLRSLRLCLLRLHAEQEVLDIVLKHLRRGVLQVSPTEATTNDLDNYFNSKTRMINRTFRSSVDQSAILAAFDAADQVVPPASRDNLVERYNGARRQIWKKIEDYQIRRQSTRVVSVVSVEAGGTFVNKNVVVNGDGNIVNVAEVMANVTNVVNTNLAVSDANEDVKTSIRELNLQLQEISTKIQPAAAKSMANDLQTLSNEIASPQPRRRYYELTLGGLKEAAEAVGEIATPIILTVAKLSALLLG